MSTKQHAENTKLSRAVREYERKVNEKTVTRYIKVDGKWVKAPLKELIKKRAKRREAWG